MLVFVLFFFWGEGLITHLRGLSPPAPVASSLTHSRDNDHPRPFQGRFVVCRLGLAMLNPHTKFEVSAITANEDMKGNAK